MTQPPPLTGLRVLEFAGLAPGPFASLLLADYGASILRIDRPHPLAHTPTPPPPTPDLLTRHKSSITLDLKSPRAISLLLALLPNIDILIDPFRPGVLEKLGLHPEKVLLARNPRLIVARLTGFRRDGKYKDMAGHDVNYLAVSGVLSQLGRYPEPPSPPANLLADFAGGGLVLFTGVLMALVQRERTGMGQVVEANMVDGVAGVGVMARLARKTEAWSRRRGENLLDGGAPYYAVYETKDGGYMAVGALEEKFFAELCRGLGVSGEEVKDRQDRRTWPKLKKLFEERFLTKPRKEWEDVFDGTDACCTPVLGQQELEDAGFDQRPIVTLTASPGRAISEGDNEGRLVAEGQGIGVEGGGWVSKGLAPGVGGEELLGRWMGWKRERHYEVVKGGLEMLDWRGSKL